MTETVEEVISRMELEDRVRSAMERILRAMSRASAEGLRVEQTGNIRIFVSADLDRLFRRYARVLEEEYSGFARVQFGMPDGTIGRIAGMDTLLDQSLPENSIRFRYEIIV